WPFHRGSHQMTAEQLAALVAAWLNADENADLALADALEEQGQNAAAEGVRKGTSTIRAAELPPALLRVGGGGRRFFSALAEFACQLLLSRRLGDPGALDLLEAAAEFVDAGPGDADWIPSATRLRDLSQTIMDGWPGPDDEPDRWALGQALL